MRLMIVEPAPGGHHLASYTRYLVRDACRRGWSVELLTSADASGHRALGLLEREFADRLAVHVGPPLDFSQQPGFSGLIRRQFRFHRWVKRAFRDAGGAAGRDFVVLMSFDSLSRAMAVLGSPLGGAPFASLAIGVRYHWPRIGLAPGRRRDALDRRLTERALAGKALKALFCIDDTYVDFARDSGPPLADKVFWVPDPGEVEFLRDRDEAKTVLGIAPSSLVVLIYGGISPRKGLERLIRGALRANRRGLAVTVLVAGECEQAARTVLCDDAALELSGLGGLRIRDRFHLPEDEGLVFGAADLVWVAYEADFLKRSAVLSQAASAGRPCIGRSSGMIGRTIAEQQMGPVLECVDEERVAGALEGVAADGEARVRWAANASRYAGSCSGDAFGRAICDRLETLVGSPGTELEFAL